ncbi:MAG: hypothetical protein DMG03_28300 [Acidobacteria bacterium]|nr:MAG: hypothetical protein DMG03_28300 [Acidobacteriota bacterium]
MSAPSDDVERDGSPPATVSRPPTHVAVSTRACLPSMLTLKSFAVSPGIGLPRSSSTRASTMMRATSTRSPKRGGCCAPTPAIDAATAETTAIRLRRTAFLAASRIDDTMRQCGRRVNWRRARVANQRQPRSTIAVVTWLSRLVRVVGGRRSRGDIRSSGGEKGPRLVLRAPWFFSKGGPEGPPPQSVRTIHGPQNVSLNPNRIDL